MSETNPYAPPQSGNHKTLQSEQLQGIGVFNDRGTLVLDRKAFRLPRVCLKSGEPTENVFSLNQRALPKTKAIGIFLAAGAIGVAIARSIFGEEFELKLPMRPDTQSEQEKKEKRSWVVVGVGFALILLGIVGSVFSEAMIALCGLGMVVGFAGLFLGGVKSAHGPFSITHFDQNYVWVQGANKTIVGMFEKFPARK